jgi:hypothetical protein
MQINPIGLHAVDLELASRAAGGVIAIRGRVPK